jgi:hypothetical protein
MLRRELRERGENMNIVRSAEVFEMSTLPVQLGKVELPGDEWNKIQRMLEERQRMLISKSVIVENSLGGVYYKTLSEDEHIQSMSMPTITWRWPSG